MINAGLPWWISGKESAFDTGDVGLIPGLGISPGEGNGNPILYLLPGKSHGQRSLVGYSPWGHKEPDTTERLGTTHSTAMKSVAKFWFLVMEE